MRGDWRRAAWCWWERKSFSRYAELVRRRCFSERRCEIKSMAGRETGRRGRRSECGREYRWSGGKRRLFLWSCDGEQVELE